MRALSLHNLLPNLFCGLLYPTTALLLQCFTDPVCKVLSPPISRQLSTLPYHTHRDMLCNIVIQPASTGGDKAGQLQQQWTDQPGNTHTYSEALCCLGVSQAYHYVLTVPPDVCILGTSVCVFFINAAYNLTSVIMPDSTLADLMYSRSNKNI